jgi:L-threonylcarbamoyladenylate synthase
MEMIPIRTRYFRIDPKVPNLTHIQEAAEILRQGGVVAFPTETVYGLGADGLNPEAVAKIFKAKGRPADNPLIMHVAQQKEIDLLAREIPPLAERLMELFWPGPLTLILPKSRCVPDIVTAGLDTVAVRMPAHPIALAFLKAARVPVAAPSANLSGKPSPTIGTHVLKDLAGKIDAVVDGGKTSVGLESTVLDLTSDPPVILRPGGVTLEQLQEVLGEVVLDPAIRGEYLIDGLVPRAPGMKYAHYAPRAKVFLVEGEPWQVALKMKELVEQHKAEGKRVGIICTEEMLFLCREMVPQPDHYETLGPGEDLGEVASRLYSALRNCDRYHLDVVFAQVFPENGMGVAIMNRLRKAASYRVIKA